jgi:hypothetical protein
MAKQRGYPDRRGMGAQSDFIAEQFVPDARYAARQLDMVHALVAAGTDPEELSRLFLVPYDLLPAPSRPIPINRPNPESVFQS